jgi:hypothetical protein
MYKGEIMERDKSNSLAGEAGNDLQLKRIYRQTEEDLGMWAG